MAKQTTTTTKTPIKVTKFQTPTTGAQNSTTTKTKTTTATAETAKAGRNYEALARQQADIANQQKQQAAKQTRATESYNRAQADIANQQKQQTAKQTRATENYERAQSGIAKQQAKKTYGSNSTAGEIFNKVTTGKSYSSGSNYTSAGMQTARTKIDSLYQNSVKPLYDNYLKLYEGYKNGTVSADEVNAAIDDYESVYNEYNPLQTAYEQLRTASAYHVTTTEEAKAMADQVDTAITAINQRLRTNAANMAQAELDLNKANEAYSKNPSAANYYTVTKAQSKYEAARGLYNASVFVAQESQTLYGDIQNTATELYNDYLEKNPNIYLDGDTAESVQKRLDKYQSTYDTAKERYEKALAAYRVNTYENKALSSEGAVQTQAQKLSSQSITNEYKAAKAEYERISGTYEGIKSLKDWLSDDDNLASRDKWEENNWTWDKVYNLYEQTGDVQYLDELVYGYGRFVETEEQEDKLVEAASKLFDEAKTLLYEAQGGTLAETKSEAAEEEARAKYWEAQENYKAAQKRLHEMGQVATRTDEVISGVLDVVVTDYTSLAAYAGDLVKWGLKAVGADEAAASIGVFTEVIRKDRQAAQEAFSTAMTNMGETETFVLGLVPSAIEMGFSAMAAKVLGAGKSYTSVAEATKGMTGVAKLGKTTRTVLHNMAQNPQYWTSFARVVGTDYVDAVNEGHDESSAFLYATVDAALNAAIEIGIGPTSSGVQGLYETETAMANPTVRKAFKETLLKTAHEEGMEEVKQGIVERALSVALLGEERQLFGTTRSTEDRDAVLSLSSALEEYIGGAALSALVSVPRTVSSVSVGAARENALRKLNTLNLTLPEELRMNKLDVQKATDAQAEDYRLALLLRLNAANSLTKANVNARADQIQAAAEKANSDKKVLGPIASELQEKGYNDANGAQVQQDLIEKILNGTKLSDEEIKKLDLNNRIVREVFVKRTGLSGTPTDAVIPLDAIRVYADTAATLAQRVQVRQQELIAQQQREEAELKTAAEAKAATETTVQPQPQTQPQTQAVEAQTAETPVQEKKSSNPFKNRKEQKRAERKEVRLNAERANTINTARNQPLNLEGETTATVINRIKGTAGVADIQTLEEYEAAHPASADNADLASLETLGGYRDYLTRLGLTDAEADAVIKVQTQTKAEEPKPVAKAEPEVEVKEEPKAEVKAEPKPVAKAEPEVEVKEEPKAGVKTEPKAEPAKELTKQETDSYTEPAKEEVKEHGSVDNGGTSEAAERVSEVVGVHERTDMRRGGQRRSASQGGNGRPGRGAGESTLSVQRTNDRETSKVEGVQVPDAEIRARFERRVSSIKENFPESNADVWEEADVSGAPKPVRAAYELARKLSALQGNALFFVRSDEHGVDLFKNNKRAFKEGVNFVDDFVCVDSPNLLVRFSGRAALHEPCHNLVDQANFSSRTTYAHAFLWENETFLDQYEAFLRSVVGEYYAKYYTTEASSTDREEEFLCRVFAGQLGDVSMQEKLFDFLAEHNKGLAELRGEYFEVTKNLEAYYAEQESAPKSRKPQTDASVRQETQKAKTEDSPVITVKKETEVTAEPEPEAETETETVEEPKKPIKVTRNGEAEPEIKLPAKITVPVTKEAKELAEARGVNLNEIKGSGKNGRVLVGDVRSYLATQKKDSTVAVTPAQEKTEVKEKPPIRVTRNGADVFKLPGTVSVAKETTVTQAEQDAKKIKEAVVGAVKRGRDETSAAFNERLKATDETVKKAVEENAQAHRLIGRLGMTEDQVKLHSGPGNTITVADVRLAFADEAGKLGKNVSATGEEDNEQLDTALSWAKADEKAIKAVKPQDKTPAKGKAEKRPLLAAVNTVLDALGPKGRKRVPRELIPGRTDADDINNLIFYLLGGDDTNYVPAAKVLDQKSKDPYIQKARKLISALAPNIVFVDRTGQPTGHSYAREGSLDARYREGWSFVTESADGATLLRRIMEAVFDQKSARVTYEARNPMIGPPAKEHTEMELTLQLLGKLSLEDAASIRAEAIRRYHGTAKRQGILPDSFVDITETGIDRSGSRIEELHRKKELNRAHPEIFPALTEAEKYTLERLEWMQGVIDNLSESETNTLLSLANAIDYGGAQWDDKEVEETGAESSLDNFSQEWAQKNKEKPFPEIPRMIIQGAASEAEAKADLEEFKQMLVRQKEENEKRLQAIEREEHGVTADQFGVLTQNKNGVVTSETDIAEPEAIRRAHELGVNMFDLAKFVIKRGGDLSETLITPNIVQLYYNTLPAKAKEQMKPIGDPDSLVFFANDAARNYAIRNNLNPVGAEAFDGDGLLTISDLKKFRKSLVRESVAFEPQKEVLMQVADSEKDAKRWAAYSDWATYMYVRELYAAGWVNEVAGYNKGLANAEDVELSRKHIELIRGVANSVFKLDAKGKMLWKPYEVGDSKLTNQIENYRYHELLRWVRGNMWPTKPRFNLPGKEQTTGDILAGWGDYFSAMAVRADKRAELRKDLTKVDKRIRDLSGLLKDYRRSDALYSSAEEMLDAMLDDETEYADYMSGRINRGALADETAAAVLSEDGDFLSYNEETGEFRTEAAEGVADDTNDTDSYYSNEATDEDVDRMDERMQEIEDTLDNDTYDGDHTGPTMAEAGLNPTDNALILSERSFRLKWRDSSEYLSNPLLMELYQRRLEAILAYSRKSGKLSKTEPASKAEIEARIESENMDAAKGHELADKAAKARADYKMQIERIKAKAWWQAEGLFRDNFGTVSGFVRAEANGDMVVSTQNEDGTTGKRTVTSAELNAMTQKAQGTDPRVASAGTEAKLRAQLNRAYAIRQDIQRQLADIKSTANGAFKNRMSNFAIEDDSASYNLILGLTTQIAEGNMKAIDAVRALSNTMSLWNADRTTLLSEVLGPTHGLQGENHAERNEQTMRFGEGFRRYGFNQHGINQGIRYEEQLALRYPTVRESVAIEDAADTTKMPESDETRRAAIVAESEVRKEDPKYLGDAENIYNQAFDAYEDAAPDMRPNGLNSDNKVTRKTKFKQKGRDQFKNRPKWVSSDETGKIYDSKDIVTYDYSDLDSKPVKRSLRRRAEKLLVKAGMEMNSDVLPLEMFGLLQTRKDNMGVHISMMRGSYETTNAIFTDALVGADGSILGRSFTDVMLCFSTKTNEFSPEAQAIFDRYRLLLHTASRMSVVERVHAMVEDMEAQYPALKNIPADELVTMAETNSIAAKYLQLLRLAENAENKPVTIVDDDGTEVPVAASAELAMKAAQELAAANPWVVKKEQEASAWWDLFMRTYVVGGTVSLEEYNFLQTVYPHYVPTHRRDVQGAMAQAFQQKLNSYSQNLDTGGKIREAKGSTMSIQAIPSQQAQLVETYVKAFRAREVANNFMDELMMEDPSGSAFKKFGHIVWSKSDTRLKEALGDRAQHIDADDSLYLYGDKEDGLYTITTYRDGKQLTAQVTPEVYQAFKALFRLQSDGYRKFIQAGNFMTGPMKTMVTGLNPFFAARNLASDLPTALVNTENSDAAYSKCWLQAFDLMRRNSDEWRAFQALGGTHSAYMKKDKGEDFVRRYRKAEKDKANVAKRIQKSVPETLGKVGELSESVTRFAEYLATVRTLGDTYENRMIGIHRAAEVTVDFSRAGRTMRLLNSICPYFNPAVQGFDKMIRSCFHADGVRKAMLSYAYWSALKDAAEESGVDVPSLLAAFKKNGVKLTGKNGVINGKRLARAVVFSVIPEFITALLRRLLDREDEFNDVSDYVKDNYYLIPLGNEHKWLRIRKTREWAALLGNATMRALEGATGYDNSFDTYFEISIKGNLLPSSSLPLPIQLLLNLAENENYAGSVIVPSTYEDYMDVYPMEVWDDDTSALAYLVAAVSNVVLPDMKINPMQWDYILGNYCGDFYEMAYTWLSVNDATALFNGEKSLFNIVGETAADLGDFTTQAWVTDNRYSNSSVTRYYDMYEQVQAASAVWTKNHPDEDSALNEDYQILKALDNNTHGYAAQIQKLASKARTMEDGEEKAEIKSQIVALAKLANDFYERCKSGEIEDPVRYIECSALGDNVYKEMVWLSEGENDYNPEDYNFDPSFSCPSYIKDPEDSSKQYVLKKDVADDATREAFVQLEEETYAEQAQILLSSSDYKNLSKAGKAAAFEQLKSLAYGKAKTEFLEQAKELGLTSTAITLSSVEMADKEAQYALARVQNPSTAVSEAVSDELVRLNDYASEYSIVMSTSVPTTFQSQSNSKEVYTLTEDEQKYYTEQRSALYNDAMTKVMESSDYTSGDDQYKAAMLEAAGKVVTKQLKADMQDYLDRHGATSTSRVKLSEGQLDEAASYSATEVLTPDNAYDSSVTDELVRLYSYSDTYSFQPSTYKPTKYTDPDDKSRVYVLTSEEQAKYQEISHDTYNAAVKKLMQTSDYKKADDEGKAQILAAMRDNLADTVKPKFLSWLASQRRSTAKADTTEEDELEEKVLAELGW